MLLMRHGDVENPLGLLYGRLPGFHLSMEGRRQAAAVGEYLQDVPLDLVVSSSLERAIETAKPVIERNCNRPQHLIDDRITECEWGSCVGMSVARFDASREHYLQLQLRGEGGLERPAEIAARVQAALAEHSSAHPEATLFVSHADPISFLISQLDEDRWLPSKTREFPKKASLIELQLPAAKWEHLFTPPGARF